MSKKTYNCRVCKKKRPKEMVCIGYLDGEPPICTYKCFIKSDRKIAKEVAKAMKMSFSEYERRMLELDRKKQAKLSRKKR